MSESEQHNSDQTNELLNVIAAVLTELHPDRAGQRSINMDSRLDKDLGLDSLARVELLARLEKQFNVSLPDTVFADAETPQDLLRVLNAAGTESPVHSSIAAATPGTDTDVATSAGTVPEHAQTLIEVLEWHANTHPDHPHIRFYSDEDDGEILSYRMLAEEAQAVAAGLLNHDIQPGQTVAIMLPTSRAYFTSFFGILFAGGIPVPVYPPARMNQLEEHLKRHIAILDNAQAAALITVPEAIRIAQFLRTQVDTLDHVVTADDLKQSSQQNIGGAIKPLVHADDIGFLQYTSGSTGAPKGVTLTHANLLANIKAYGQAMEVQPDDICISWLPLYHDMGLIGSWFGCLYFGLPLIIMSPLAFLARPQRWLKAIHRYRGTLSAGPNFAYEMCVRRIRDSDLEGLDLSSWRGALNGAEAISPKTLERFCEKFAACGFQRSAMMPVYGLAESSVALAFPPLNRGPVIDRIQREPFMRSGLAIPAAENETNVREFVASGHPIPGHQVRIVDDAGIELADRHEGRLQFKGPSATSGYYRNPEKTRELFDGDWLESGDRAYIADADIYITGRNKDVIIKGGRNIYPEELEDRIGNLSEISKNGVAVFGTTDAATGTEQLVVVAETRRQDEKTHNVLRTEINAIATDLIGMPPDDIVLAPPRSVPKTSSGKIRRSSCRELYQRRAIGKPLSRPAWQLIRLVLSGVIPTLRYGWRFISKVSYAGYFWLVLGLTVALTWPAIVLAPFKSWSWPIIQIAIKFLRRSLGIGLTIHNAENLPDRDQACVFVANHSSYLDSLILIELLNRPASFVAKAELKQQPLARLFLDRIDTAFVERFDQEQGLADARHIVEQARSGRSFLFYPEGTCQRMPGLLSFHLGAFETAAQAGLSVVPITLCGTRHILRPDTWFPHPGSVSVYIGEPITPPSTNETENNTWAQAVHLRNAAREHILNRCGEPDLGYERIVI
ncbi:MAG: AMP-binding protein [Rhodospirillaceae bacterium]|jgi:acyl carrier protein